MIVSTTKTRKTLVLSLLLTTVGNANALRGGGRQLQLAECPPGREPNEAGDACQACAEGHFAASSDLEPCTPCEPGTYQPSMGADHCLHCSGNYNGGSIQPNHGGTECVECGFAEFPNSDQTMCCNQDCPQPGMAVFSDDCICYDCVGQVVGGADEPLDCFPCDPGFVDQPGYGSCMIESCPLGQQTNAGDDNASCQDCPPGTYKDTTDNSSCQACPPGLVPSPSKDSCVLEGCPLGKEPNSAGDGCQNCSSGTYSDQTDLSACQPCDGNTEIQPYAGMDACEQCPSGLVSNQSNDACVLEGCSLGREPNSAGDGCQNCSPGTYSDQTDLSACQPCDGNTEIQPYAGMPSCEQCPLGFVSNMSNDACVQEGCPLGREPNGAGDGCQACSPGTYSDQTDLSACQPCDGNTEIQPNAGMPSCEQCPLGFVSNMSNDACVQEGCPLGREPNSAGDGCQDCSPGTYSDQTDLSACQPCDGNTEIQPYAGMPSCEQCPLGFVSNMSNDACVQEGCPLGREPNSAGDGCQNCSPGTYSDQTDLSACQPCDGNTEMQPNAGMDSCEQCPLGFVSNMSNDACVLEGCSLGREPNSVGDGCQNCSPGTYSDQTDLSACQPCGGNTEIQPNAGMDSCELCPLGFVSNMSNDACVEEGCPLGREPNGAGDGCQDCSPGTFSAHADLSACQPCAFDEIQPYTGQTSCLPCDAGASANAEKTACEPDGTSVGGVMMDPHVQKWDGSWFDYNGECDLVMLMAPALDLDIQIRTTIRYDYSFVEAAAIRIGNDIMEVGGWGEYLCNGVDGAKHINGKLLTMGDHQIFYSPINKKKHSFVVPMDNLGHNITITTFKDFVNINLNLPRHSLEGSQGLMGDYRTGKPLARDGNTILEDFNAFGQEWQVMDSEPNLFAASRQPQAPSEGCRLPPPRKAATQTSLNGDLFLRQAAMKACKEHALQNLDACVADTIATGDLELAESGVF